MAVDGSDAFLAYHEPNIVSILTLISFFLLLAIAEWLAGRVVRASLIGDIVVGLIYGAPLGNILAPSWQETFLALGYLGLVSIIFEGGLTVRLDLLSQNLLLSLAAALLGVLTPIALSFALLHAGFHHTPLEAFIVGTALCSTSLGTTFVVLSSASASKDGAADFSQTRVGTVLVGAALLDDVCGLVLVSVIQSLRGIGQGDGEGGGSGSTGLGWVIGRPVLASVLMALLTPLVDKFAAAPLYRRFVEPTLAARFGHTFNVLLMAVILCAFLAIAAYSGSSILFGAFLAGAFLSGLPDKKKTEPRAGRNPPGQAFPLTETFDKYLASPHKYVFQPLFFASIGFAIPFLDLWNGEVIWKGIVYAMLMAFGKLIVGTVVPIWDFIASRNKKPSPEKGFTRSQVLPAGTASWAPATLLGAAMVARGEIGLLIIQLGLNETPFLSRKAFVIGIWAIVLNTIIGPVLVGALLSRVGSKIANDVRWGVQPRHDSDVECVAASEQTRATRETSPPSGAGYDTQDLQGPATQSPS
ncbi:hypothetical protein VTK56DRAFT_2309 [Thermocarpiscus australiensis]